MLVHGFARGTLIRVVLARQSAYFRAQLIGLVVVVKCVLLCYSVRKRRGAWPRGSALHGLALGQCLVQSPRVRACSRG